MNIEISQVVSQILSFLIMLWILKRYAWKPFLKIMDDRRNRIEADFNTIEALKTKNEKLLDEYQKQLKEIHLEAKSIVKEAREKGLQISREIEKDAHLQAKAIVNKAQEELKKEIYKAKKELRDELIKITLMATQKIIETEIDADKQKKIVDQFVERVELP